MSRLHKPYELSLWQDIQQPDGKFEEQRVAVIGSDSMESLSRALSPNFKKKINGDKELTFKMYSEYIDPITGEKVINPFAGLIVNESKLKLKYRNKWYDFIVKDVQEDSSSHTKVYTALDQFVIELSKNGYGLELDTSLMNNTGNLTELAEKILPEGTGWKVKAENPQQYITEQLVKFTYNEATVYAFFSSCKNQPKRFQYVTELGKLNSENIYDDVDQTYIDTTNLTYTTDTESIKYGFSYPPGFKFEEITALRANRLVYTHKSKFNPALNRMVYSYNEGAVWGFTETDYITPNLIQNLVTNSTFKSTSGWTKSHFGGYQTEDDHSKFNAKVEVRVLDSDNKSLVESFSDSDFGKKIYTSYLHVELPYKQSVLVNSGFYDNRTIIKNLTKDQKFVLLYKTKDKASAPFSAKVAVGEYNIVYNHHNNLLDENTFISFNSSHTQLTSDVNDKFYGYYYTIGTVSCLKDENGNDRVLNEKEYQKLKVQLFITNRTDGNNYDNTGLMRNGLEVDFEDFQVFPYVANALGSFVVPGDDTVLNAVAQTTYYYYEAEEELKQTAAGARASQQEYKYCAKTNTPHPSYIPDYIEDKVLSITVKQSNYFNAIQSLCETFEVWADFDIKHDDDGNVTEKWVVFKENIEKLNYAGFRYGVNLKQTKRTIDSKAIVTKLIVPDNTNEFAPNGFCSIARAGANTSGENYIFDFSYYYNFNQLDQKKMHELFYRPAEAADKDELQGYYIQLSDINNELNNVIDQYTNLAASLMKAEADKQVAEQGKALSIENYQNLADTFLQNVGYAHTEINTNDRKEQIKNSNTLQGYLVQLSEYYSAWKKYENEAAATTEIYNRYKDLSEDYLEKINELNESKQSLNSKFYQRFFRFIQEGTWKDDNCIDNDKYYADAVSTASNSSVPKVTYTFSVIDLSQMPEYELFEFDLGDKTWVEDSELFGEGREEVVITEINYALEEPDKTSIKIQNHKDQFSSLFQKTTATVQSVQYAAGAWDKAANFASANPVDQAAFLQEALNDAETKLQNAGDQSVVWDKTGITVTDVQSPNEQIRIIGGAIMLRDPDSKNLDWTTAITAKGINAKVLTAGTINTGKITIMYNNEPYFRWDAFGITAYHFNSDNPGEYLYGLDTKRGVRFDRFGIYGYSGQDGATWHPDSLQDVVDYANFALTWEGLYLKLGQGEYTRGFDENLKIEVMLNKWHTSVTKLGKAGKYLYNAWVDGSPSYDSSAGAENNPTFVKVMAIGNEGNEQLVIYDDGTLVANKIKLTGSVEWVPEASPSRSVYGPIDLMNNKPNNNWYYKDIPDYDPGTTTAKEERWHKIKGQDDVLYCRTDTAGAIWDGPFLISGRSIAETITEYSVQDTEVPDPSSIPESEWIPEFPIDISGKFVYTRVRERYDDNSYSSYRYSASSSGAPGAPGDSVAAIRIFAYGNLDQAPSLPTNNSISLGEWYEYEPELSDGEPYVYTSTGTKKTTYNNDGTPKQTTYQDFTTPELWSAYLNDSVNTQSYATLLKLTNNGKSQGLFYDNKGQLYLNASYINAGALTIIDSNRNVIFSADYSTRKVQMAGWFIGASSIKTGRLGSEDSIWLVRGGSATKAMIGGSDNINGWSLGVGKNFGVTSEGIMYATGAKISGTITAESGKIAGWEITKTHLIKKGPVKENKRYGVAINLEPYITGHDINVLVIGDITNDNNWSTAAFRVTKTGEVHARAGTIGGYTIKEHTLVGNNVGMSSSSGYGWAFWAGSNDAGAAPFRVGHEGLVIAKLGSIAGWDITDKYFGKVHTDGYGMGFNSAAIASNTPQTVFAIGLIGGLDDTNYSNKWASARFRLTNGGRLYATDVDIMGVITATSGSFTNCTIKSSCTFDNAIMSTSYGNASGAFVIQSSVNDSFKLVLAPNANSGQGLTYLSGTYINLQPLSGHGQLLGTWKTSSGATVTSDINKKHNIEPIPNNYDSFFNFLESVRYKYNDGTSDRYHVGFIAQQIQSALDLAGISSQDFAGLVVFDKDTNQETWTLRYSEFVALNTWQIQMLKPRITAAEQEIAQLKLEIQQLRTELENLQKS